MCLTTGPAKLSKTIIFAGEVDAYGQVFHTLGYQNTVVNMDDKPNAMLLAIPALQGTLTSDHVLDCTRYPMMLVDMATAVRTQRAARVKGLSYGDHSGPQVEIFTRGIYTCLLARHAADIAEVLPRVEAAKRPEIPKELFMEFERLHPGFTFLLCCFNNAVEKRSEPIFLTYRPNDPTKLFLPAFDGHDGKRLRPEEKVAVDHMLVVSSHIMASQDEFHEPAKVKYSAAFAPELASFMPKEVIGIEYTGFTIENGNFEIAIEDVRRCIPQIKRVPAPGLAYKRRR